MKYKLLRFSLLSLLVMLCGNVFANYVKVQSTAEITDGDYLIVYEAGNVAFNGALSALDVADNTVAVTIENNVIASTTEIDNAVFTISTTDGTLKSAAGNYIGVTSNSNGLKSSAEADAYKNVFSIDEEGNAVIAADFEGSTTTLRFNKAANQNRFRYYKSGQEAIQLYKKTEGGIVPPALQAPVITPATGTYYEAQSVSIACATEGATIFYSTEGDDYNEYAAPFTVEKTTTVKAYAQKGEEKSATTTATLTIAPTYTSIADMLADITSTKTNVLYTFDNLTVTYVIGKYTYVNDGQNNMLFFGDGLGLVAGDKVSGSVKGQLYTYNNLPEFAVNAADIQVTVASSNNEVLPTVVEIANLGINLNNYITIKNAVYVSANGKNMTFKVDDNEFVAYNQFNIEFEGLEADKAYDITGFGGCYKTTIQIFPITITEATAEEEPGEESSIHRRWRSQWPLRFCHHSVGQG